MNQILKNARIVCADRVVDGELSIHEAVFADITSGASAAATGLDCEGDFLVPGLVDVHSDHIEHHFFPRPGVQWPAPLMAVLAHDMQMLSSGITTVLDSLSLGDYNSSGSRARILKLAIDAISRAADDGLLRTDHFFHFRCEISDPYLLEIVEAYLDRPMVKLFSVMDHTPGQRQWRDLDLFRKYRKEKKGIVWTDEEFEAYLTKCRQVQELHAVKHRHYVNEAGKQRDIPVASHDDTTIADIEEAVREGITISEFPTTVEAARRARQLGMKIVMGSPNVILGGSHSGNVSALELASQGLLDVLTSDYVPGSLLHAAFVLSEQGMDLPAAIATVTTNPAEMIGLADRGRIAEGLRADLLRVRLVDGMPVIRNIWVAGRRYL